MEIVERTHASSKVTDSRRFYAANALQSFDHRFIP
jgi:hypothetical protein